MYKEKDNFVFGFRPVIEAIEAGKEVDKVFFKSGLQGELYRELFDKVNKRKIPFQFVPVEKLNRISRKNHQGVIAYISYVEYQRIENIIPSVFEQGKIPLVLVLDKVTDVRNFGAIIRTSECTGVDAVIIPLKNAARINADTVKTSAGALYNINICRVNSLINTIDYLKKSGLQIVAATEKTDNLYFQTDMTSPTVILMGAEDQGISPELLKTADYEVKIPLLGKTESLNVSSAASVLLYEVVRQRM